MPTGPLHVTLRHLRRAAGEDGAVSDAQLLERFVRHREETAFELLVWRHERLVLAACRRILHDAHDAEDAFQATFLALARQAGSIGRREALAGWLHRVACRAALRLRARNSARARHETLVPLVPPEADDDPAEEAVWDDLRPLLDEEVGRLPEKYRVAVVLCYLQGLTYDEAARRLGCPRGTVSIRLTRARDLLRKRLVRRGFVWSGAALAAVLASHGARAATPAALVSGTVRAALAFAADRAAAAGLVSARTVALAEGVLRAMWMTKVKLTVALLVSAVVVIGLGAAALAQRPDGGKPVDLLPGQKDKVADPVKKEPADGDRPLDLLPGGRPKPADSGKADLPAGGDGWRERHTFPSPGGDVMGVAFSPDGKRLAAAGLDGAAVILDMESGKAVADIKSEVSDLQALAFSPDGRALALGGGGKKGAGRVQFLDVVSGKTLSASDFPDTVTGVAFSPDGRLAGVTGADKMVHLLDVTTGKEVRAFAGHADVVFAAAFSADGKLLAAGGGPSEVKAKPAAGELHVWDVSTGKEIAMAKTGGTVTSVAFSPDGRTLATGSFDDLVRLWDVASMQAKSDLKGHAFLVRSVAWSPDGKTLASAGYDETVRVWDTATGQEVAVLKGHKGAVQVVRFSPDGRLLASGSAKLRFKDKDDGKPEVKLWEVGKVGGRDVIRPGKDKAGTDWTDGLIKELARPERTDRQVAEGLYLAMLGRFPTEEEVKTVVEHLKEKKGREEALMDLVFALTNSKDFAAHLDEMTRRNPRLPKK
jgi:RNA polymerase sigma factor (sigma-70 family)